MKKNRIFLTIVAIVFILIAASWLVWFQTQPVYDPAQWAAGTSPVGAGSVPQFILYTVDTRPASAVAVLRDGLMRELARSGGLPPGYPKLTTTSWATAAWPCPDTNLTAGGRYLIQLSETQDNYLELPMCGDSQEVANIYIFILPVWPWARVEHPYEYGTPTILLSFRALTGNYIKPGQLELIYQALTNMGLKLYVNPRFH